MADHYRAVVASLERVLDRSDSEAVMEARDLVRRLIETVIVTPLPERGKFSLTVQGKIAALVGQDGDDTTILGAGGCNHHYLRPTNSHFPMNAKSNARRMVAKNSSFHSILFRTAA